MRSPKQDQASVARFEMVKGKLPEKGAAVVLVRSAHDGSPWWVQPTKPLAEGEFISRAQFGNDTTLEGAEFRIVVWQ